VQSEATPLVALKFRNGVGHSRVGDYFQG